MSDFKLKNDPVYSEFSKQVLSDFRVELEELAHSEFSDQRILDRVIAQYVID